MELVCNSYQNNIRLLSYQWSKEEEVVRLAPVGDLHIGLPEFNRSRLEDFLQYCEAHQIYILLMGDLVDMAIKDSVGDVYNAVLSPQEALDMLIGIFKPYRDRILGIVSGNHEWRIERTVGLNISKTMCDILDLPPIYSDGSIYLYIQLGKNQHARLIGYKVYALHGWGGSRTIGAKSNNLEKLGYITDANCIIMAHTHNQVVFPRYYFTFDNRMKGLKLVTQVLVNSGSFCGYPRYAVRRGLTPTATDAPIIEFSGKENKINILQSYNGVV